MTVCTNISRTCLAPFENCIILLCRLYSLFSGFVFSFGKISMNQYMFMSVKGIVKPNIT